MFLKQILQNAQEKLKFLVVKKTDLYVYVNKEYIKIYFNEVKRDIDALKNYRGLHRFEKEKDSLFKFLAAKYRSKYCSSTLYKLFSFDNQLEYLYLRAEIDDLINSQT